MSFFYHMLKDIVAVGATITLLSHTGAGSTNAANITTPAISTVGANLIVIGVGYYSAGVTPTVSDSQGNTWNLIAGVGAAGDESVRLYYCVPTSTSASHTFSVTAGYPAITVAAFSNANASPFVTYTGLNLNGVVSIQPGSITPSTNGNLLVTVLSSDPFPVPSINSSFTIAESITGLVGGHFCCHMAYKIQTTAAPENPAWSWSGSCAVATLMGQFKN